MISTAPTEPPAPSRFQELWDRLHSENHFVRFGVVEAFRDECKAFTPAEIETFIDAVLKHEISSIKADALLLLGCPNINFARIIKTLGADPHEIVCGAINGFLTHDQDKFRSQFPNPEDPREINEIIDFLIENGGSEKIKNAAAKMRQSRQSLVTNDPQP